MPLDAAELKSPWKYEKYRSAREDRDYAVISVVGPSIIKYARR